MSVTDHDKVSLRAFQIWEAEGRPTGRDLEHWQRAEIELRVIPTPARAKPSPEPKKSAGKAAAAKQNGAAKVAKADAKTAKATPKAAAPKRGKTAAKV